MMLGYSVSLRLVPFETALYGGVSSRNLIMLRCALLNPLVQRNHVEKQALSSQIL